MCNQNMHVSSVCSFTGPFKNVKKNQQKFFWKGHYVSLCEKAWTAEMAIMGPQTGRNPKPEPGHWQRCGPLLTAKHASER